MLPFRRVVLLLADGARPDVLAELLHRGELPAIARAFPDASMRREATSTFPSTTGPAFLPFLTGCYPGTLNVPGIRWFDRAAWAGAHAGPSLRNYVGLGSFRLNADFPAGHPTLFDCFSRTVNIFSSLNRGVASRGNLTALTRAWWWWYAHETDRWDKVGERARHHLLRGVRTDPDFLFCLVPDIDCLCHLSHPRSTEVAAAYRRLDRTVGELFGELERRRWRDETLVMIVSDHGHSAVATHLDIADWVESLGRRALYPPKIWRRAFDSVVMVSGNGMAHLYLRDGARWTQDPVRDDTIRERHADLLAGLLAREEIDIVATRGDHGAVVVRSRSGTATVREYPGGRISYRTAGGDPFCYNGLDGTFDRDDLLRETWRTPYPDGIHQVAQLFRSARTGDLVVSARVGHDLRHTHERPEHLSGHGAIHGEHLRVPWLSTQPLPDGPLRTVDVFPAILRWTGRPVPPGIDGRDVFGQPQRR